MINSAATIKSCGTIDFLAPKTKKINQNIAFCNFFYECVARFKISYNDAQTLPVSLLIYKMFIHHTNVQTIIVPGVFVGEYEKSGLNWWNIHDIIRKK